MKALISSLLIAATAALVGCESKVSGPTLTSIRFENGSGYGGSYTLAGMSFYRLDGSYSCTHASGGPPERSYHSVIYFPLNYSPYAVLRGDSCGTTESTLCATGTTCPDSLELPPAYYPSSVTKLIGYEEFIYEARKSAPQPDSPSEQFVESWCRSTDATTDTGIDVMIRTGISSGERAATIIISRSPVISDSGGHWVEPFSVTKRHGGYALFYEAPAFNLTIDLDIVSPVPYKPTGKLRATIDGKSVESDLYCRVVR